MAVIDAQSRFPSTESLKREALGFARSKVPSARAAKRFRAVYQELGRRLPADEFHRLCQELDDDEA